MAKQAVKVADEVENDPRKPAFVLRARQPQTPEQYRNRQQFWQTIGAMWPAEWTDKETGEVVQGWSIKINSQPLNWDGSCVAMKPLPKKE